MTHNKPNILDGCHSAGELLRRRAEREPNRVFAFHEDESITLGELDEKSSYLENALTRLGISKGQKIAIISHSTLEYLTCEYGIFKAGAVCVPLNCLLKAEEISYILDNADVTLAFVHSKYLDEFLKSLKFVDGGRIPYYVMDERSDKKDPSLSSLLRFGKDAAATNSVVDIGYDDPCCILYTSGTTGRSKGVVYENFGLLPLNGESYVQQMMDVIGLGPDDTTYLPFPLYHVLGQVHQIGALRNGGKIVLAERFSVSRFWSEVLRYKATVLVHQGASIPLLLKQPPSDFDRKHDVRLTVGAGIPNEEVWKKFEERFGIKVYEHYAQTEGAFFGAGTMPTNRIGTIGKPFSTAEIRVVDENIEDVRQGESGQLISKLKASHARKVPTTLYYKDPVKAELRFTKDGWFKAGDMVRVDEEGFLHYVGKVETFIRYRGENISPIQIESVLSKHPAIDECIAVAVPNPEFGGDDIKIVVALCQTGSSAVTPSDLISWCEKVLPKFMVPRYVEIVPELKKTEQTKKILRSEYAKNSSSTWDRLR